MKFALLAGMTTLFLSGCDTGNSANTTATPTTAPVTAANAVIKHAPSGTVTATWDHTTHLLNVHAALTGLAPSSSHPVAILEGTCRKPGKTVYQLTTIKAQPIGFADAVTKIKDVADGIPATGWSVTVFNGPDLSSATQSEPISCADLVNAKSDKSVNQAAQATLSDAFVPDQSVSGTVQLNLNNKQLTVVLNVKGLAPNSKHMAHIHTGSCASQGAVVYPLKPLQANAAGEVNSTTVISNVSEIPPSGWYVNIHRGDDNLSAQSDFDPIGCGDITPNR
ncbi:CHRD domain-containing protein [Tengunoibacter tsumagoiensis]|nr:CHRD domain-containing protein [Tengunoibacter tsumagoiensis]